METLSTIVEEYKSAFHDYLQGTGEVALEHAYELGRKALDEGVGVLAMSEAYQEVLEDVLQSGVTSDPGYVAKAAATFFVESISPFEITHRSFREANTSLKAQQARYREMARQHFRALLDAAPDAILVVDEEGRILLVNQQTERSFGYQSDELLGKPVELLVPDRLRQRHMEHRAAYHDHPRVRPLSAGLELYGRRKSGEEFPVEISLSPLETAESGPLVISNIRDISQRKQTEEQARELQEQLRLLVEGVKDYAILMLDPDGRIVSWNEGAKRIKGYSAEEIIGRHFSCFYPREDIRAGVAERHLETARLEGRAESEGWRVRKDGTRFWGHVVLTAIRDEDGQLRGFAKITRDATERRHAEEAMRQMNEALESQIKRIAHALHDESGQLLASVHNTLEEVVREAPPGLEKRFQQIRVQLDQVEDQLRRLSHELRPTVLDDLGLRAALQFLADGVSRRTRVAVTVQCPSDARWPAAVETALYRIAQEALTNVWRHAKASRAEIRIQHEPGRIRCSIKDDGVGFGPASMLSRESPRGLGLIGIQARLEALGGTLEIHSHSGAGSELIVAIPLES